MNRARIIALDWFALGSSLAASARGYNPGSSRRAYLVRNARDAFHNARETRRTSGFRLPS